ncbi:hypothetical protein ACNPDD_004404, partial [Vibrio vulnificus]
MPHSIFGQARCYDGWLNRKFGLSFFRFSCQSSKSDFQIYESFQFLGLGFCLSVKTELILVWVKRKLLKLKHNKRFKRDSQRVAFLPCVGFGDYGVMRKFGRGVGCPLT